MAKTRLKTVVYRRAVWVDGHDPKKTLEYYLRVAHRKLPKIGNRKFVRSDGQIIKGNKPKDNPGGGLLLHLVAGTPGDHASTVPAGDDDLEEFEVGITPAPAKKDYMDGDVFALVRNDHVFLCSTVLRDASFSTYCRELFKRAGINDGADKFELQNVGNVDKVKLIKAQGVKAVEMRATLYEASTSYIGRKDDAAGAVGAAFKHLKALFGGAVPVDLENVSVSLSLSFDTRKKDGRISGDKLMRKLANDVVDDEEDDYVIVTGNNQRISQKEVFVRQKVTIDRHGKSVLRDSAWESLRKFESDLKKSGMMAQ
ncbi:hypothetical protein KEU06_05865 [Pseudaminobacter sp. 19-2017]|uniref:DUF4747 family protein n=1 Tax=Pseudaminobacter soli (ex Zhang et al. 2022) TaxID=2831468 RepID=A0A942I1J8_9HYPH|nr:hypothetical protein [Pseudaminobacter soli]MBS3648152.1 hypothetical protein [Pseudaminobacter soli]